MTTSHTNMQQQLTPSIMIVFALCTLFGFAFAQNDNNVALIVGGYDTFSGLIQSSVEIFGCPSGLPVVVDDLPVAVYNLGGIYLPQEESVLICGGLACDSDPGACAIQDDCFKWNPENGWQPAEPLVEETWAHILATGPNLDQPEDDALVPLAVGLGRNTEIFDNDNHQWVNYRSLEDIVSSGNCLVQGGSQVYYIAGQNQLKSLDLHSWEINILSDIPFNDDDDDYSIGRCAVAYVNGGEGEGYFAPLNINVD